MTALAALVLLLPDCGTLPDYHREALAGSALVAEGISGIPARDWIALSWVESTCGQRNTNSRSSAIGPWQVIPRWSPLPSWAPLHWWPVNAAAAGLLAKAFRQRCGNRWPACYNEGWAGAEAPTGDGFLDKFNSARRALNRRR